MSRAVWQISGGPAARAYAEVFQRHGVALIGPGDAGPWNPRARRRTNSRAASCGASRAAVVYANLPRLKQPAADLFARMQRP